MTAEEAKVQAIVLGTVKYGDSGTVLRTFTPQQGLLAFMVHSLHSKKAGQMRPSMTLPMTILDVVINHRGKGNLKTIQEVRPARHWSKLHSDPIRMTLCTFASEVIQKVVTEDHQESFLFQELRLWLERLDRDDARLGTAPHELLLIVARQMGCFPHMETYKEGYVFDMMDGHFIPEAPDHTYWMTGQESAALNALIHHEPVHKTMRSKLLGELLSYLRIHHEPFGTLKSIEILRTLLS